MAAFVRTASATAAGDEAELVKTLLIFSGTGLLLSLLSTIAGLDPVLQAVF
jgi:hypothetical protein